MRFDVIAAAATHGHPPVTISSHDLAPEAAAAAKAEALSRGVVVEVWDRQQNRAIFRARGAEWRWLTR